MKKVWEALSGRKTYLGVAAWLILGLALDVGWVTQELHDQIMPMVKAWTGVSIAHKVVKRG